MSRFSSSFLESMPKQVAALEAASSVEVVVVAADQSGNYHDVEHQVAFVFCILGLFFILKGPVEFPPEMVEQWLVEWTVLFYAVGLLLTANAPFLRRLVTTRRRRHHQVVERAQAAFVQERVSSTRERTGMMVYLSAMEREALILTDLGIDAVVPAALFHNIQAAWSATPSLAKLEAEVLAQLPTLVKPLAEALPSRADDTNQLPDEVRLLKS